MFCFNLFAILYCYLLLNLDKSDCPGFIFRSHCHTYLFSFILSFYAIMIVKVKVTSENERGSDKHIIVTVGPGSMQC